MTKYEQAIKYFEEQLKVLDDYCKRGGEFAAEALEHTKTAIEALRKQVPRALIGLEIIFGCCPSCGIALDGINTRHCENCGQEIDFFVSECISLRTCYKCTRHDINDKVCPYYADKVDEIRRIHEEA